MNFSRSTLFATHGGSVPALLVLALVLTVAVYTEVRENRIPNWLTLSGMALGLLLGFLSGHRVFWSNLGGLGIGFGFLFIFYVFGGVGGGDVKLMGAVGALMGVDLIQPALVFTTMIGALLALLLLIWRKDFWLRVAWAFQALAFWRTATGVAPEKPAPVTVPYGVAIAAGCLVALLVT